MTTGSATALKPAVNWREERNSLNCFVSSLNNSESITTGADFNGAPDGAPKATGSEAARRRLKTKKLVVILTFRVLMINAHDS